MCDGCLGTRAGPVKSYVRALPQPFPMRRAASEARLLGGRAAVFRHPDGSVPGDGQVGVLWAVAGSGNSKVEAPVVRGQVTVVQVDGSRTAVPAPSGRLAVALKGDPRMAPPVMAIDRPLRP